MPAPKSSNDSFWEIANRISQKGTVRSAGTIEFRKDQGPVRRNIRVQNFNWDADRFRELSKILWAVERGHGYIIAALRLFSRMPSSDFSPDGLLGGVGYIQSIPDLRRSLAQATEILSTFSDTLHDEVNAAHWSQVSPDPQTQALVDETQQIKADPEAFVQEQYDEEISEDDGVLRNPSAADINPILEQPEKDEDQWDFFEQSTVSSSRAKPGKKKETHSELPKDDSAQKQGLSGAEVTMNTTGENPVGQYAAISNRIADSSLPVDTLSTPRMDHLGPGGGGETGHYNSLEDLPSDDMTGEGFNSRDYIYEGPDANGDGVTGYDNPTKGDETVLHSSLGSNYSWLPGSRNEKLYNYYEPGLSEADIAWMRANDAPDNPMDKTKSRKVYKVDPLFRIDR